MQRESFALPSLLVSFCLSAAVFVTACAKPSVSCGDTQSDVNNCGFCGVSCTSGQQCSGGSCMCEDSLTDCNGTCVSVISDKNHCGTCTTVCSGATPNCDQGHCSATCSGNTTNCNGSCVNVMGNDPLNCGGCGKACAAGMACNNGSCACPSGQTMCGSNCVDLATNNANCGMCGKACTGGTICTASACGCPTSQFQCPNGTCAASQSACSSTGQGGSSGGQGGTSGGQGGSSGGQGGTSGGQGGSSGNRTCAVASPDVISDFEEGTGTLVAGQTPNRNGWWYVYPNPVPSGTSLTPGPATGPIPVQPSGSTAMCDKYSLEVKGSGFGTAPNNFVGFGASFLPMPAPSQVKNPFDVSAYTGISFRMKSGSGTPPAVYFEVLTKESQPTTSGGSLNGASGSPDTTVGLYNTRGWMLNAPWSSAITTSWQTYYVPFGALVPRWMPAVGASMACPSGSTPKCQAPAFNPASVLGIQISMYRDPGFPTVGTAGTFDLWIDDVTLVKNDTGLQTISGFPNDSTFTGCSKPTAAAGKYLVTAYNNWKSTFVKNGTVIRPENGNDTVSEGIAYGMMIAVYMNDKTLFDQLYAYWNAHLAVGKLMTWCIPSGGGSCSASGGSATDADTDAAFALLNASKKFSQASYKTDAMTMIGDIFTHEIDGTTHLPKGGSNYASVNPTNPSYFAPGMYRYFMASGDTHDWGSVITAVYGVINGSLGGSNGLFPAWCNSNCTAVGSNGGANDMIYQYDSHRIPWRIGSDLCWNGSSTASGASTYVTKVSNFFSSQGSTGVGRIADLYQLSGTAASGAAPNSSSIIGTAAVAAMGNSAAKTFVNDAYQVVFDQATRGTMAPVDTTGKTPYSYFNATVGLLTLLTMTGNFRPL